ncbi:unnamed protein product [Euphydryas editha]|uniref:Temptin n=2 Tax=Euphydryas editha TaxID=104508 RepID=A0AAU9UAC4_EUPED|nr:unnamed protein product [Euphydryas editha]
MKTLMFFALIISIYFTTVFGRSFETDGSRCVNMWDEGCINGQLPGSGRDDDYINGGFNPGKRCINMWDEGCTNGQLPGAGLDNDYVNGGFNPGKRCLDTLGGCNSGWLDSSSNDMTIYKY